MRKISSSLTFFVKYVNPACILVVLWILSKSVKEKVAQGLWPPYSMGILVAVAVILFFLIRKKYASLVDDVYQQKDGLLIRKRAMKLKIKYSDIRNLELIRLNPPIIKLYLHSPSQFGLELSFVPPARLFSFMDVPLYEELKQKVEQHQLPN